MKMKENRKKNLLEFRKNENSLIFAAEEWQSGRMH